jgi:uncharacterized membrane protein
MTTFLLFLHILLAIVFLGPLFLSHLAMPVALRQGRDGLAFARFFHTLEARIAPATLLIAVVGVLLVEDVGFDYSDTWIWLALVLVAVATAIGGGLIGPTEKRAIATIEQGGDARPLATRIQLLGIVNVVILIVIVWLMIDKPA